MKGLKKLIIELLAAVTVLLGGGVALGAIPTPVALFEDSLQNSISSTATTMTLVRGTDKEGTALNGTYGFIIDEGDPIEEFVIADCVSTACTNMTRGISVRNATSSVTALKQPHRKGASIKITDFPLLGQLYNLNNGDDNFPNLLYYDSSVSFSGASTTALTSKDYVDNSVNQGAATSTEVVGGISELATALEQASSTDEGGDQPLVLQAKNATSTPGSTCDSSLSSSAGALCTVIATLTGKISQLWIDLTAAYTWVGNHIFNGNVTTNGTVTNNATSTDYILKVDGTVQEYTAGQALTANRAVYATTTRVFHADNVTGVPTSTLSFIGFVLESAAENDTVHVQTTGMFNRLSGLTPGLPYYINTSGQISTATSTGSYEGIVGRAASSTAIDLDGPFGMQFISSVADTADVISVPQQARMAIVQVQASGTGSIDGQVFLTKIGLNLAQFHTAADATGSATDCSISVKWDVSASRINLIEDGTDCTAVTGTAYFYR